MEESAIRCMLEEILYALDKRERRHVPSYPAVLGLYIASFRGGGGGEGDKGGGKNRDNNKDNDHND